LWKGAEVVPLTPKTLETLALLIRNSGHIVEKEELLNHLWPSTFVEEKPSAMKTAMSAATLKPSPNAATDLSLRSGPCKLATQAWP
jgi:hypothetical protein